MCTVSQYHMRNYYTGCACVPSIASCTKITGQLSQVLAVRIMYDSMFVKQELLVIKYQHFKKITKAVMYGK